MHALDLTLASPAGNLALDEALLLEAEEHGTGEHLRFWMSPQPFIVIGIGAKVEQEVHLGACEMRQIPVLRRCSGGGTVIQGPGCLNYSLILQIPKDGALSTIQGTNRHIMKRHARVLSGLLQQDVRVEGHTDLAVDGMKVSGNAQRRLRRHLLFHGTFLLNFDLPLITELLPLPDLQPGYRKLRSHDRFLMNLDLDAGAIRAALMHEWKAEGMPGESPSRRVTELLGQRYDRREWNFRR